LNPVDGLLPLVDDMQNRLQHLILEFKTREAALQNELHVTRLVLLRQASHRCNGTEINSMPDVNGLLLADKMDDDQHRRRDDNVVGTCGGVRCSANPVGTGSRGYPVYVMRQQVLAGKTEASL
jgi:hypothetical protein